jgi:hypothetical protein
MIRNRNTHDVAAANKIQHKAGLAAALSALAIAALILGGCGGKSSNRSVASVATSASSAGSSSGKGGGGSTLAYAKCMRNKGIAGFPDPATNGVISMDGSKIDTNSAQFKAADEACKSLLPPQGQANTDPAEVQKAALEYAKCMREKGVTKFPDPNAQGGFDVDGTKLGVDPDGSIFKSADAACQPILQKAAGNRPRTQSSPQVKK